MSPEIRSARNAAASWRHVDWLIIAAVGGISAISLLMIYSSTRQKQIGSGLDPSYFLQRQALFLAIGLVAMVAVMVVDYKVLLDLAPALSIGGVLALLLVLSPIGSVHRGAQAWFNIGPYQLQPSELAKLILIVGLAAYCSAHRGELDTPRLLGALALVAVPLLLIYAQNDLGTAMVFVAIVLGMLLIGGASGRQLGVLLVLGLVAVAAVLQLGVLKEYQRDRVTAFLDPQDDSVRSAYNLRQSQIAIAAGGLGGRGLFRGTQTNLSFVPEQHTDFIFTAVGEELGFVGATTLLALFGLVIWRTWRTASAARDQFGQLLCVGVLAMLVFQIFENVGMTMGITPIAGIPLPMMSYGGSSVITSLMAVGLVVNVYMRRFR
ncbi:MAG: rod shape-determining protein RodA [Acidimicrobiales bacterium]